MNLDETRLRDIKISLAFYYNKLKEENTELGESLIRGKIAELEEEEKDILARCKVEI